jgi:hypothetical protein
MKVRRRSWKRQTALAACCALFQWVHWLRGMKVLQSGRKLMMAFLGFSLPLLPCLAQDQPEISLPPVDLVSAHESQFNIPAECRLPTLPVSWNLDCESSAFTLSSEPSKHRLYATNGVTAPNSVRLLRSESCFPGVEFEPYSACLNIPLAKFNSWEEEFYPMKPVEAKANAPEKTYWKEAFWQSFGFLAFGHAFRLANDDGARYLLIHKPFWHDYWASSDNFQMSRWGDGDSFIVNYIGHPMEGAVYGDIFLNNDPKGRRARFGKSSSYWYSRLRAMAWATVWEAYFEIGPVLSEAAIGNEGGYTYYPGCGRSPCAKAAKPATNNTGWVDFVITPVVGMVWIVMEDAIEREFVDRLAHGSPALKYKILRGSLAPSHTFANIFAGKSPWFRYAPEGSFTQTFGGPLKAVERPAWKDERRYSLGAQFISMSFPSDGESCANCRKFYSGYGFDFTYRFTKYAYFDSAVNLFPGSGSNSQHGGAKEGLVGVRLGPTLGRWGLFFDARNGFIHYDKTLVAGSSSLYQSTWRYALDLGGSVEFSVSRKSTFRFSAGTTLIHYLEGYTDPNLSPVSVISTQYYSLRGNPYLTSGYVFRF